MSPLEFVYWLQGFLEIAKPETVSPEQLQEIKNHISLVLTKKTPEVQNKPLFIQMNQTPPDFPLTWAHNASC